MNDLAASSKPEGVKFALAFVVTQAQLDRASKILAAASVKPIASASAGKR